ncbi:Uncharacterized protein DAT39_020877, partial [Clarias magur]
EKGIIHGSQGFYEDLPTGYGAARSYIENGTSEGLGRNDLGFVQQCTDTKSGL